MPRRAAAGRPLGLRRVRHRRPVRRGARRRGAAAPARVRPLHRAPGRRRQVPDGGLRRQPLQRAAALGVPGGDGQGATSTGSSSWPAARSWPSTRGATATRSRCSTRCTTWRRWARAAGPAGPGPRAGAIRDWAPRRRWPRCAASWRRVRTPAGTRQFIRVLQLLAEHPQSRIERAIEACRAGHAVSAEAIVQRTRALAAAEGGRHPSSILHMKLEPAQVSVPPPDLSRFNRLLGGEAAAGPTIET